MAQPKYNYRVEMNPFSCSITRTKDDLTQTCESRHIVDATGVYSTFTKAKRAVLAQYTNEIAVIREKAKFVRDSIEHDVLA